MVQGVIPWKTNSFAEHCKAETNVTVHFLPKGATLLEFSELNIT